MPYVTVSIGSNIEREKNIRSCIGALKKKYNNIVFSAVYQSKSVGFTGDDFYNLVARFFTEDDVRSVIDTLRDIEIAHGRVRDNHRFSSRTLDIDLLLYDDLISTDDRLRLPRDEITHYAFVLGPLAEIAGNEKHPVSGVTYKELWQAFDHPEQSLTHVQLFY